MLRGALCLKEEEEDEEEEDDEDQINRELIINGQIEKNAQTKTV